MSCAVYFFALPEEWCPYFAVGQPVKFDDLKGNAGGNPEDPSTSNRGALKAPGNRVLYCPFAERALHTTQIPVSNRHVPKVHVKTCTFDKYRLLFPRVEKVPGTFLQMKNAGFEKYMLQYVSEIV